MTNLSSIGVALQNALGDSVQENTYYRENDHYEIVSTFAYLIGVKKELFERGNSTLDMKIFDKLETDKNARIIRELCTLRTEVERGFIHICKAVQQDYRSISTLHEMVTTGFIDDLEKSGIRLYQHDRSPVKFVIELNKSINSRINNCRQVFPDWIMWDYIKKLFVIPNGSTEEGLKEAATFYYEHKNYFPYQAFLNWPEADNFGNILSCDRKFVCNLYEWNNDSFNELSRVTDVKEDTKDQVYDFIEGSEKIVFVVDCENSDPYAFCAALRGLGDEKLTKVSKIVLYDDVHASSAWDILKKYVSVKIEYSLIERLRDNKSLADVKVTTCICREFFMNNVDAFVLVSSDSDYYGLIEELPNVRFLVMAQKFKFSQSMREALTLRGIFFCYIDDFYSGDNDEIKQAAMVRSSTEILNKPLKELDIESVMEAVISITRVNLTPEERKSFINRYLKKADLKVDEEGKFIIQLPGTKGKW